MSLTKSNFDNEFGHRTIADSEFYEREDQKELPFIRLPDCVVQCNDVNGISLKASVVNPFKQGDPLKAVIKGRYLGLVCTEQNKTYRTLISIIESYGFIVLVDFFLEEADEGFTNLSFTIKQQ